MMAAALLIAAKVEEEEVGDKLLQNIATRLVSILDMCLSYNEPCKIPSDIYR